MYISHSVMEGQRHNNPVNPRCFWTDIIIIIIIIIVWFDSRLLWRLVSSYQHFSWQFVVSCLTRCRIWTPPLPSQATPTISVMEITIHSDLERKTIQNIWKGSDVGENLDNFLDSRRDVIY